MKQNNQKLKLDSLNTIPDFIFGEWVLIDKNKSGQIIHCHNNHCTIDENGMWTDYEKNRLIKEIKYFTPSEQINQSDQTPNR